MKLESKFNLRRTVFALRKDFSTRVTPCPFCGGEKRIAGRSGLTRSCPECFGSGHHTETIPAAYHVLGPYTIGRVLVQVTDSPGAPSPSGLDADNYKPQSGRREEYMMAETGIGGGTIWHAEDLYATRAEAEVAAAARNHEVTP